MYKLPRHYGNVPFVLKTLLLIAGFLVGCTAAPTSPALPTRVPVPDALRYEDPNGWYALDLPQTWQVFTVDPFKGLGASPMLVARPVTPPDQPAPSVVVQVLPLPPGEDIRFLRAHWSVNHLASTAELPSPQLQRENVPLRPSDAPQPQQQWYRAEYLVAGDPSLMWVVYMTVRDDVGYVLVFTAPKDDYSEYSATYQGIWQSMEVTPPPADTSIPSEILGTWENPDKGRVQYNENGRYEIAFQKEPLHRGVFRAYNNVLYLYSDQGSWTMQVYQAYDDMLVVDDVVYAPVSGGN